MGVRSALCWLGGGVVGFALLYWQVILAEGAYLGPRAVRLIYRLGAPHYDAVRAAGQVGADNLLCRLLCDALDGVERPVVLDVATGTGRVPLLLGETGRLQQAHGLDLTPQMLSEARRKHEERLPSAPLSWCVGEAGTLPWPTAVFDLVTCLEALEYVPRPRQALAEMARVLRPGATLLISTVPDAWARLLPGRALTQVAMRHELQRHGLSDITFMPWQPGHYELIWARKTRVFSANGGK